MSNKIGAKGARDITLPPTLSSLNLTYNPIGDEGARDIKLRSTLIVSLGATNIGDEGARDIEKRHPNIRICCRS